MAKKNTSKATPVKKGVKSVENTVVEENTKAVEETVVKAVETKVVGNKVKALSNADLESLYDFCMILMNKYDNIVKANQNTFENEGREAKVKFNLIELVRVKLAEEMENRIVELG